MRLDIFSLKEKNVLITGAAGLLGVKHAEAIAMAGGRPILADIDEKRLREVERSLHEKFGVESVSVKMDVCDLKNVETVQTDLSKKKIFVDVLINNAARNPAVGASQGLKSSNRLENFSTQAYLRDVEVGLNGAVYCSSVFGSHMAERGKGVIINVASDLAIIAPDQRLYRKEGLSEMEQDVKPVSYSVVKHGLIGLTKYLATYWAERGVRCNAISPGGVKAQQNAQFLERVQRLIPNGRMANPDEYQGAIIFLSSEASSYMNGANLILDGGRSVW